MSGPVVRAVRVPTAPPPPPPERYEIHLSLDRDQAQILSRLCMSVRWYQGPILSSQTSLLRDIHDALADLGFSSSPQFTCLCVSGDGTLVPL